MLPFVIRGPSSPEASTNSEKIQNMSSLALSEPRKDRGIPHVLSAMDKRSPCSLHLKFEMVSICCIIEISGLLSGKNMSIRQASCRIDEGLGSFMRDGKSKAPAVRVSASVCPRRKAKKRMNLKFEGQDLTLASKAEK